MVKVTTKSQRRKQRENRLKKPKKKCKWCKKVFRTVFDMKQHLRTCIVAKRMNKPLDPNPKKTFQDYGLQEGDYIPFDIPRKISRPKEPKKGVKWLSFYSYLTGARRELWGCVHPETGNLVFCLKKWPCKFQVEEYFRIFFKQKELFNDDGTVKDRWGAAVEFN